MTADAPDLTPEEIRNGWTAESKAAYHAERAKVHQAIIEFDPAHRRPQRPNRANGRYSPLRRR